MREYIRRALRRRRTCPSEPNVYRSKKDAQDAHEAIRPTSMRVATRSASRRSSSSEELTLYTLIWNRFVASQMAPAVYDQTTVDIAAGDAPLPRHRPGR